MDSPYYKVITSEKCLLLNYISIEASHYKNNGSDNDGEFKTLREYGKT